MIIGVLTIELHFPYARSLKDKRRILHGFKDRIRERYNVSIAEIDHQDKWQRASLGLVSVSGQASLVEETLQKVVRDAQNLDEAELAGWEITFV
jgi:uncharacterized protein